MADFTDSKASGSLYPTSALEADFERMEPLLTPEQLLNRFLRGIDLSSQMKDPLTGKPQRWTAEGIKDIIDGAFITAEEELGLNLRPIVVREKHPFDRNSYNSYGFFILRQRPASRILRVSVTPPNDTTIYEMPLEWVETKYMNTSGQINIIPMTAAQLGGLSSSINPVNSSNGGSFYLTLVNSAGWVPAYWQIEYISGFCDGNVPRVVNDLIGCIAASDILSMLATTYAAVQSHSLGIDGLSQSISTPGPQIFQVRLEELDKRRKLLVKKLKSRYNRKIFSSWL